MDSESRKILEQIFFKKDTIVMTVLGGCGISWKDKRGRTSGLLTAAVGLGCFM